MSALGRLYQPLTCIPAAFKIDLLRLALKDACIWPFPLLALTAASFQAAAQSYTNPFPAPPLNPKALVQGLPATQAYYNAVSFTQDNPIQVGSAKLVMQSDGNFVMYYPGGSWSTFTAGHDCSQGCHADFQPDGNLVLYNGTSWFWASHTDGKGTYLLLSRNAPYASIIGLSGLPSGPLCQASMT